MHYRILFLLVVFAQTSALRIAPAALSRADAIRAALGTAYAVSTAAPVLAVDLDDEDEVDANDEVPDVRMRGGAPRVSLAIGRRPRKRMLPQDRRPSPTSSPPGRASTSCRQAWQAVT